jgi:hypothetical protein
MALLIRVLLCEKTSSHALDVNANPGNNFRRPVPFECEISARFPEAPGLLAQERELRGL